MKRFALAIIRYWLELLVESGVVMPQAACPLQVEANELLSIAAASILTARKNEGNDE